MLAALLLVMQAAPLPEIRTGEAEARTLTIYRDDLAFVTETYEVEVPKGRSRLVFEGVNDRIVPQSAVLTDLGALTLTRDFDRGLLSPATLFRSLVGERAVLRRTMPGRGDTDLVEAEVVSAERGVVVSTEAGLEALDCAGLDETLLAPGRPDGLLSQPQLSVVIDAPVESRETVTLRYLASGLGWSSDYVLTVGEDETADLRGWLTFTNETADSFDEVPAAIVAGTLQRLGGTEAPETDVPIHYAYCWPRGTTKGPFPLRRAENPYLLGFPQARYRRDAYASAAAPAPEMAMDLGESEEIVVTGSRIASEERFGDYRLYRPPGPVTLTPYRTKQIRFLDEEGIGVAKRYDFTLGEEEDETPVPARTTYVVDNDAGGALARALPAGTVRVMTVADGETYFLGEDEVRDLAVGLPAEVTTGTARDVSLEADWTTVRQGEDRYVQEIDAVIRNASPRPAPVEVVLPYGADRGWTVSGEEEARDPTAALPTWRLTVPPGGTARLRLRASADG